MTITKDTVSASIAQLSDFLMADENVDPLNQDSLASLAVRTETLIAEQLARTGMAMSEALALAEEASMSTARPTDASKTLAEAAFANRGAPVPAANDTNGADASDPNEATDEAADEAEAAPQAAEGAEGSMQAVPKRNPAMRPAAPQPGQERAQRLRKRITYTVEEKEVSEVFKNIPANLPQFAFKIPFYTWSEQHPGIPKLDPNYNLDADSLATVLYAIVGKKSCALIGPHGCGKTKLIEQVAAKLNMPLTTFPMDGSMSRSQLFGQEKIRATEYGSESYFQYGLLPMALEEPGILLFDEFDRADEQVQYACHSVYNQTGLTLLEHDGRTIPLHAHNRVFGTANTKGRGSDDGMYGMASEMSEATRDRWSLWVEMDYSDIDTDFKVLKAKITGIDDEAAKTIARLASQIREAYKNQNLSQTCSMRQQLEAGEYAHFLMKTSSAATDDERNAAIHTAIGKVIVGRANDQDGPAIQALLDTICPLAA